jgi:hypothetical protein
VDPNGLVSATRLVYARNAAAKALWEGGPEAEAEEAKAPKKRKMAAK